MGCFLVLESGNVLLSRAFPIALSSSGELAQSRPFGRSLRFPTLRLAVSPTGRARLRSHRRRAMENLAKYNVALTRRRPGSWTHCPDQKEINPTFVGLISFWNPATSYSPGRFPSRSLPPGNSHSRDLRSLPAIPDSPPACFRHWRRQAPVPLGAHGEKPSQVQCMHSPADGPGAALSRAFPISLSSSGELA